MRSSTRKIPEVVPGIVERIVEMEFVKKNMVRLFSIVLLIAVTFVGMIYVKDGRKRITIIVIRIVLPVEMGFAMRTLTPVLRIVLSTVETAFVK